METYTALGYSGTIGSFNVSISKADNGYRVEGDLHPSCDAVAETSLPDQDEALDGVIDGISAFLRHVHDIGAGEGWKVDDDKEKVRNGVRALFPALSRHTLAVPLQTNHKSLVFERKEDLMAWLAKTL